MNITAPRELLLDCLGNAKRATASRSTLPILGHVMLATDRNTLHMTGTDLEIAITAETPVCVDDPGTMTVPVKVLDELLKALPKESDVTLKSNDRNVLTLISGTSEYSIYGLPADEFPAFPTVAPKDYFTMRGQDLKMLLSSVAFAKCKDEGRPILCGVCFTRYGDLLTLAATDTHRLAVNEATLTDYDRDTEYFQAIVPESGVDEILKLLPGGDAAVTLEFGENMLRVTTDRLVIVSRLIDGQYPAYERVIPDADALVGHARVNVIHLLEAVKRCNIVAKAESSKVLLTFTENAVRLHAQSGEVGEGDEEIPCRFDGVDGFQIAFNATYLLSGLPVFDDPEVVIGVADPLKASLFTASQPERFRFVCMPMQQV